MKIGFVTLDWSNIRDADGRWTPGGAGWYRIVMPARYLAQNGTQTVYGADVAQKRSGELVVRDLDGNACDGCDIIVFQRWMSYEAADVIKLARACGQVVVNEIDDNFHAIDPANRAFGLTHPRHNALVNRNHYQRAIMASSAITVSTKALAKHYEKSGKPVHVLENCIDLDRWQQQDVSGPPVVGWVGATGFRSGDLETLRGVLGPWLRQNEAAFHHSGAAAGFPAAADLLAIGGGIKTSSDFLVGIEEYPKLFGGRFNIGIVPLANKAFNEAKSHIKGLEYAASGIPFIASSTAEYRKFTQECDQDGFGAGWTAVRPRDWRKILTFLSDSESRVRAGEAGRAVAERYDMANRYTDWLDAYTAILEGAS